MIKHSLQFKLKVVKQYLEGSIGFHSLACEQWHCRADGASMG